MLKFQEKQKQKELAAASGGESSKEKPKKEKPSAKKQEEVPVDNTPKGEKKGNLSFSLLVPSKPWV